MNERTRLLVEAVLNKYSIEFKSGFYGHNKDAPRHGWWVEVEDRSTGHIVEINGQWSLDQFVEFVDANKRFFP